MTNDILLLTCDNCGAMYGDHRAPDNRCPVSISPAMAMSEIQWRRTYFVNATNGIDKNIICKHCGYTRGSHFSLELKCPKEDPMITMLDDREWLDTVYTKKEPTDDKTNDN